jgi:uncharacterized protein (DUF2249 family)
MNGQQVPLSSAIEHEASETDPWPTELDARAPTPPNHLTAILAALGTLPAGHPQYVRTRSEPTQLLHALAEHEVSASPRELPDGSWCTLLRRVSATPAL